MTAASKKVRYRYLDIARGLGIMLVIISHAHGLSSYLINYYIPIFFLISGFTYREGRSYGENVARKAKRLLIPYFAYSFVLLAVYMALGRSLAETKSAAFGILYSRFCLYDMSTHTDNVFLFTIANGAMWYLTAFFMASLVYHLVIDFALKCKRNLVIVFVVLTGITMALAELPVLLPWSADIACVGALFMIVGTLLGRAGFYEKKQKSWLVLTVFAAYLILSAINPGINMSVREYGVYQRWSAPFFILIGISGSMLCIWAAKFIENTVVGNVVEYIGKNTIILMAFHIFGLEVFEMIAGKFIDVQALTGVAYVFYVIARVGASVVGCLLLGKGMDEVKAWKKR
ncbi:MAG: acyltransferase family protein [Roseburia sp.]